MEVLVGFLSFFAMVFGICYMYYSTRNKERLALIEKGADAAIFNSGSEPGIGNAFGRIFNSLKIGLFLIGIGVGIAMGYFVSMTGMDEGASYTAMIFLFGGLGLVIYYLLQRRNQ